MRKRDIGIIKLFIHVAIIALLCFQAIKLHSIYHTCYRVSQATPSKPENATDSLTTNIDSNKTTATANTTKPASYQPKKGKFKRIVILGERNSGTNAVENLLQANILHAEVVSDLTARKHYMQALPHSDLSIFNTTLVLLTVRNPYDWLQSMYKHCYCCTSISWRTHSFEGFLDAPYPTLLLPDPTDHDCPADYNLYNSDNKEYKDIFDIRYKKLMHFLNVSTWVGGFDIVRWEDLLSEEQQVERVRGFSDKFGFQLRNKGGGVGLGVDPRKWVSGGETRPFCAECRIAESLYLNSTLTVVSSKSRDLCEKINSKLVPVLEGLVGYRVVNCSKH